MVFSIVNGAAVHTKKGSTLIRDSNFEAGLGSSSLFCDLDTHFGYASSLRQYSVIDTKSDNYEARITNTLTRLFRSRIIRVS